MANQSAPVIDWQACHPESGLPFFCGSVEVPLDYNAPEGEKLSLALIKLSATSSTGKIGSLFFNPGGPANSGFDLVLSLGPVLPQAIREHFDVIGFDPRGTGRSSPLLCFDGPVTMPQFFFPRNPEEEALRAEFDMTMAAACQSNGGNVLNHMSTANVARDLDFLRRTVGDSKLNYVGYSHGSFLGITYANLFPDKVRAMVLDGVIDPVAYTTGYGNEAYTLPVTTRLRIDEGSQATLNEFFRLCDQAGEDQCSFAGASASKFDALVDHLRETPIHIADPLNGSFDLTYDRFISTVFSALASSLDWSRLATALDKLHAAINDSSEIAALKAGIAFASLTAVTGSAPTPNDPTHAAQQLAVMCSDSINPDNHEAWSLAGAEADENIGVFGRLAAWQSSPCAVWQGSDPDRYLGPFTQETPEPILIVGNRFDPITPYEGALQAHSLLPNSALLTLEGWGHTSLLLSSCVDQAVTNYLLTSEVAGTETSCQQDEVPFTGGMELISIDRDTLEELLSSGSTTSTGSTSVSEISLADLLSSSSGTSTETISLDEISLGELLPLGSTTSTETISLDEISLGELLPLGSTTSTETISLGETSLGELLPLGSTTSTETISLGETSLGELLPLGSTTSAETISLGETPLGELIPLGSAASTESTSLSETPLGELIPLGSTTSTETISLSETPLGELTSLSSTTSTESTSLSETTSVESLSSDETPLLAKSISPGVLTPAASLSSDETPLLAESISSGILTPAESLSSGETPLSESISTGILTPAESLSSGETPLSESISTGILTPAEAISSGTTTPPGETSSGSTTPPGQTSSGTTTPPGQTSSGSTTPPGQTSSGSTTPAGQTSSGTTTPTGQTSSGTTTPAGQTSSGTTTPAGQTSSGTTTPAGQTNSNGTEASTITKSFTIYDPDTGAVTIPAVQVGDKIEFANVKMGFNPDGTLSVLSYEAPNGSPVAASAAYDPALGTATIPEVLVNGVVEYVNVKLAANPDGTFSVLSTEKPSVAKSFTIYDPATGAVTIPAVQVGDEVEFTNVKLGFNPEGTLSVLFSQLPEASPVTASAAYDPAIGSATIPEVLVNGIVEFINVKLEINPDGTFSVLSTEKPPVS